MTTGVTRRPDGRRMRRFMLAAGTALAAGAVALPASADPVSLTVAALGAYASGVGSALLAGIPLAAALTSTTALVAGIVGGVSAAAQQLLMPAPSAGALKQQVPSQGPAEPRRIIYGRTRVAHYLPFHAVTDENGDDRNIRLVHVLAGHECDGLEEVWFDDELVWTSGGGWTTYNDESLDGYAELTFHAGTDGQEADQDLVENSEDWTAAHRGRGVCWVHLHLIGEIDVFKRGIPKVTYVVRGAKVYDPRTQITAWSDNPALAINDWVLNSRYGYRERAKFWDEAAVITAANICDETVSLAGGGSEKRYTIGGSFTADMNKEDVLRAMLSTCAGSVPREGARRRLLVGAYRTPVVELTDDDLAGRVEFTRGRSIGDTYTGVRGRFMSPEASYIPDDYPEVISDAHDPATGDPKYRDLDLIFTPSSATAQRLAKLWLLQQSQKLTGSARWRIKALKLRAGDTFLWTSGRYGFDQKVFEVTDRALIVEGDPAVMQVALTIRETSAAVHDWTTSDEAPYVAGKPSSLGNPFNVDAPGLTVSDELRIVAEQVATVLVVSPASSSNNTAAFDVQVRKQGETAHVNLGRGESGNYELNFVEDGVTYEVRARAVTVVGGLSKWTDWIPHAVVGKAAPPSDVTGFRMAVIDGAAHLIWNPVPDPDLSHYRIRHSPLTSGALFRDAVDVVERVARPGVSATVPWQSGTYLIVAYDKSGNRSANATGVITTISGLAGRNVVETVDESAPFGGTHSQTVELAGGLQIARVPQAPYVADLTDVSTVDDWSLVSGGDHYAEGIYTLSGSVDLGAVYTSRLSSSVTSVRYEAGVGVDGIQDVSLIEDWSQVGSGLTREDDVNVALDVRYTEDDPGGAPVWSAWAPLQAGDYRARAFEFRLRLATENAEATPRVTAASVIVDMPDRNLADRNVSSGAGAKAVGFSPAFRVLKGLTVNGQDMQTGDYMQVTGESESGFTVTFRDSAGTAVDRIFSWHALGYGEAA